MVPMNELSPQTLLVLVPLLPLAGAILTVTLGRVLGRHAHLPAIAAIAAAFAVAATLLSGVARDVAATGGGHDQPVRAVEMTTTLWNWADVADAGAAGDTGSAARSFSIPVTLRLDPLTATLLVIITGVGLLVAIYSIGYMHGDPGYPRFFALVAAFVFSMSMLVAASNFLLVYVFWEAVGACSYLLIGFWFTRPEAAKAAKKAFLVNRVGDFGLAVATFLIWMTYGTLDFDAVFGASHAPGPVPTAICLLLLLAACGKSAQLPLHVWLPDAMEGPTPASSLIHAATMVTAGVYLVARSAPLFVACPGALTLVSIVGATTALVAALIGTVQNDLKRVLAYSTISQLGYMFASLGTGTLLGFTAAIFHLVTHAFFKALLFMGAGSVMHSMGGVIDMRRFGGLRRIMPITAATFLVGALALAGVAPFAGFYSKDEILASLHSRGWPAAHGEHHDSVAPGGHAATNAAFHLVSVTPDAARLAGGRPGSPLDALDAPSTWRLLYWMSLATAALTAFYTFRAFFMTFTGPTRVPEEAGHHAHESPPSMTVPLVILAGLSTVSGWWLFSTHSLATLLAATPSFTVPSVAATATPPAFHWDIAIQGTLAAAAGIVVAALGHLGRRSDGPQMERFLGPLETLFANRFFFDQIYAALVVRPLELVAGLAAAIDRYLIDGLVDAVARVPAGLGAVVRHLQSGLVQRYALAGVIGVLLIVLALVARAMG
jgi:NADH-quinone oxidoreductase subunit L